MISYLHQFLGTQPVHDIDVFMLMDELSQITFPVALENYCDCVAYVAVVSLTLYTHYGTFCIIFINGDMLVSQITLHFFNFFWC